MTNRSGILYGLAGILIALSAGCNRPAPCDGNTCGGHGVCRVTTAAETDENPPFERYKKERLVEVCDCNGKAGFEYRPIGCGPAGAFKSCVPEACETFVNQCDFDEVCISHGPERAPECKQCPDGKVPKDGRMGCEYILCRGLNLSCPDNEACQDMGQCGLCVDTEVFDPVTRTCRSCPAGFRIEDGICKSIPRHAYLVTRLEIKKEDRIEVFGALNANGFFQSYWAKETNDGYNMIWDQDLLLIFVLPELEHLSDAEIPTEAIDTEADVFNGLFVSSHTWREYRNETEPKDFLDPRRPSAAANYIPGELTGDDCAKAVGVKCNPGHFRGDDLLRAKYASDFECSPKLANLKLRMSRDRIETIKSDNWLVMPYEQTGLLMQAYKLKVELNRRPTGLCDADKNNTAWPCTGYTGRLNFALRAVDLLDSFRRDQGGGISEDLFSALLGDPDIDQDKDGNPDSYSLQVDVDLTPVQFVATTTTSTTVVVTSTSS
jgi:hypothetical protein